MVLDKTGVLEELKLISEEVPLGKGSVIVSEISAVEWDELISSDEFRVDGKISEKKLQPALVARAVLNPDGSRMFTDDEAATVAHSAKKPFRAILKTVMKLNGLGDEAVKNSEPSPVE
jgi:hypothetical protein